jgi:hypothetical protein
MVSRLAHLSFACPAETSSASRKRKRGAKLFAAPQTVILVRPDNESAPKGHKCLAWSAEAVCSIERVVESYGPQEDFATIWRASKRYRHLLGNGYHDFYTKFTYKLIDDVKLTSDMFQGHVNLVSQLKADHVTQALNRMMYGANRNVRELLERPWAPAFFFVPSGIIKTMLEATYTRAVAMPLPRAYARRVGWQEGDNVAENEDPSTSGDDAVSACAAPSTPG